MDNTILWQPSDEAIKDAEMTRLMRCLNNKYQLNLTSYSDLHHWAVLHPELFWGFLWDFLGIVCSQSYTDVLQSQSMLESRWFVNAKLNYAENCLRFNDEQLAIIGVDESGEMSRTSYKALSEKVSKLQQVLLSKGVLKGDRVVALVSNCEEAIVCFLACASIGAIWASCSTEFGVDAVESRFGPLNPTCFIFSEQYVYKKRSFSLHSTVQQLFDLMPTCKFGISLQSTDQLHHYSKDVFRYDHIMMNYQEQEVYFEQLPAEHPLYILFSSGTTGKPKAIVHSIAGTLIEHLKEFKLHCNAKRTDVIFYYTTTAWMMWNWLVSGLAVGSTIVVFDGAPFYPDDMSTWTLIEDYGISIYGTSAKFINSSAQKGLNPKQKLNLESLNIILSTGSVLTEEDFDYVYQRVKDDVQLSSISGGTDIVGCFALGNPIEPVRRGYLQSISLGYNVQSFNDQQKPCFNQKGELVCVAPFPSMPIYFWNDDKKELYKQSYFSTYVDVWHHSDFIEISDCGAVKIYGRSDATLNRAGVRIGSSEIYQVVNQFDCVEDSLVVHLEQDDTMILFVQLVQLSLDDELIQQLKQTLKLKRTPRHVPDLVFQVNAIPYTVNGKKMETLVKKVLLGDNAINVSSLKDPTVLDEYKQVSLAKIS